MTDPTNHPRLTLHLGTVSSDDWGRQGETRAAWILESTDPAWEPRNSGRGNVNRPDQIAWAKEWAAEEIGERVPYEVSGWIDPTDGDPEPFWVPRLVQVTHTYTIVDTDNDVMNYTAESRRDAEAVNERILHGSSFIRLRAASGRETYVNTRHALVIAYEVTRTEVPTE